ncbi:DUF3710 domain-containing protein [Georgenia sp. 10Sc9-8]|uniref:DUF3710 domain-containing protein n=1 Tax=Georgenia halotolerans TaxID=3028317 RepID=A0ABT5U0E5_9MICO|nr:DUF3710 domain-containing protein [Georgenia halotolerans]
MSLFRRKSQPAEPEEATEPEPVDEQVELGPGPWDVVDVPDLDGRLDLGSLRVPRREGMQVKLEIEKKTQQVVAVSLAKDGSSVQLQVFAAPRSAGIWDELREEIAASVRQRGGTCDDVPGTFGPELVARVPATSGDGQAVHRPARFVGVDGPRWFLRAVFTGRAALDQQAAELLEGVLQEVVVVRGQEAHAPRDVLALQVPGRPAAPAATGAEDEGLHLLRRGPEITETR